MHRRICFDLEDLRWCHHQKTFKVKVERITGYRGSGTIQNQKIDDIDAFFDDDLSGDGILDFGDEVSSSIKRKLHATMAGATVGKKQSRSADKRPHNPTNRLGVNVAIKDQHVLYATENRSLKDNRRLLMVPGMCSKKVLNADAPALFVFPVNVLLGSKPATSFDVALPQSDHPISSIAPAVDDAQLPTGGGGNHQQNADVASSMSAAPFAASRGDGGDGGDDDDNSSSYRKASDYGVTS